MTKTSVRKRIEMSVSGYHSTLPNEHIQNMSLQVLIAHTHPLDRGNFCSALFKAGLITEREDKEWSIIKKEPVYFKH